jgi:uncharacterized protein
MLGIFLNYYQNMYLIKKFSKLKLQNLPKNLILFLIKIYQFLFSFDHSFWAKYAGGYRVCIHTPSCSAYTYEAIEKYGVFKGGFLGIKRVVRCAPWGRGGFDPVP